MTQHTPGPWTTAKYHADTREGIQIWDSVEGYIIADVVDDQHDNSAANAALIAAAPETAAERDRLRQVNEVILKALRDLVGQGDNGNYCDRCDSSLAEGHAEGCPIRAGEAALAAAEGPGDTQS